MKGNEKKNNLDMTDPAIYSSLKIPLRPNPWFVDDGEPNIDPL